MQLAGAGREHEECEVQQRAQFFFACFCEPTAFRAGQ